LVVNFFLKINDCQGISTQENKTSDHSSSYNLEPVDSHGHIIDIKIALHIYKQNKIYSFFCLYTENQMKRTIRMNNRQVHQPILEHVYIIYVLKQF
jgi:hypothetical protein